MKTIVLAVIFCALPLVAASIKGRGPLPNYKIVVRNWEAKETLLCDAAYANANTLQLRCELGQEDDQGASLSGNGFLSGWRVMAADTVICSDPVVDGFRIVCESTRREQR